MKYGAYFVNWVKYGAYFVNLVKYGTFFVNSVKYGPCFVNSVKYGTSFVNSVKYGAAFVNSVKYGTAFENSVKYGAAFVNSVKYGQLLWIQWSMGQFLWIQWSMGQLLRIQSMIYDQNLLPWHPFLSKLYNHLENFCRSVPGFATDCPCSIWYYRWTTCLLYVDINICWYFIFLFTIFSHIVFFIFAKYSCSRLFHRCSISIMFINKQGNAASISSMPSCQHKLW